LAQWLEQRSVSARSPPLDELEYYEQAALGPASLFGCSLADAMAIQSKHFAQVRACVLV
jgi:hypothetical protein